jgi:CheY-like chemotaxis protein
MLNILLASRDKASMSALEAGLEENDVQTAWAESGSKALSMIIEWTHKRKISFYISMIR